MAYVRGDVMSQMEMLSICMCLLHYSMIMKSAHIYTAIIIAIQYNTSYIDYSVFKPHAAIYTVSYIYSLCHDSHSYVCSYCHLA